MVGPGQGGGRSTSKALAAAGGRKRGAAFSLAHPARGHPLLTGGLLMLTEKVTVVLVVPLPSATDWLSGEMLTNICGGRGRAWRRPGVSKEAGQS
jgi:hypothetical protein